jgi:hypothetical protein
LLPDGKIGRRDRQPTKCEHVTAWLAHVSNSGPGDFIDGQLAFPFTFDRLVMAGHRANALLAIKACAKRLAQIRK